MKSEIIEQIEALLLDAKQRKTSQGVKVYEITLDQLRATDSDSEVSEILSRLKEALIDIDTHGFYPAKEYALVKKLLSMP